jgi:NitT/TauT family transport system permease protein
VTVAARVSERAAIPAGVSVALIGLWELGARSSAAPSSVASPTEVWSEFLAEPSRLWHHVQPTLVASIRGFAVAAAVAFAVAAITVLVPRLTNVVYSASVVTYSVPLIALAPVLIVWIGTGPELRVTIAAIAGFFPVVVGCVQGFRALDAGRDELLRSLSASGPQRFRYLVLPESLPYLFAGLKVSAASAVLGAIIAEWSGATRGLGFAMISALSGYNPPRLWLTMVAATLLTVALYQAVSLLERLVVRWDIDRDAVALAS